LTHFRALLADESGNSVVELGLLAPILAGVLFCIVDLGRGFNEKLVLEQVAQRTVEKAMQGVQADPQTGIFSTLREEARVEADIPLADVTVRYWLECNGVSQNTNPSTMDQDYRTVCPVGQRYARFLEVSLQKAYTPTFNMPWLNANAQGKVIVRARAGIRVQ
jgi:Flp pilus assembly pilin Flp